MLLFYLILVNSTLRAQKFFYVFLNKRSVYNFHDARSFLVVFEQQKLHQFYKLWAVVGVDDWFVGLLYNLENKPE